MECLNRTVKVTVIYLRTKFIFKLEKILLVLFAKCFWVLK